MAFVLDHPVASPGRPTQQDRSPSAGPRPPEPTINELTQPADVDPPRYGFEQHPPEDRAQILRAVVAHSTDALLLSAKDDATRSCGSGFVNDAFTQLLGYGCDDLTGESPGILVGPETDLDTLRRIEAGLRCDEMRLGRAGAARPRRRADPRRGHVPAPRHRRRGELVPGHLPPVGRPGRRLAGPPAQRGVGRGPRTGQLRSGDGGRLRGHRALRQPRAARGARLRTRTVRGPSVRRADPPRRRVAHLGPVRLALGQRLRAQP